MREIFVDTSAWAAIEDSADANHQAALVFKDALPSARRLVTSSSILDESYTLLLMNVGYRGTHEVFAFDHHFEQMGFTRIP